MTRKDYELVARCIRDSRADLWPEPGAYDAFETLIRRLTDAFWADNPRFSATRFYDATRIPVNLE